MKASRVNHREWIERDRMEPVHSFLPRSIHSFHYYGNMATSRVFSLLGFVDLNSRDDHTSHTVWASRINLLKMGLAIVATLVRLFTLDREDLHINNPMRACRYSDEQSA
ncbi:hypothetical protein PENTCL1PPCAC_26950 [Pristionchus entomophagus]|uniref:Uncharacterized protein n=1 Tax=Pristionchus entomophagus TaxID=358040 RepID=A0AAV5UEA8_9BILA|nr:hypothetical protein PENTCL1PPCAC_26950 [Pristionchus entomophagus]